MIYPLLTARLIHFCDAISLERRIKKTPCKWRTPFSCFNGDATRARPDAASRSCNCSRQLKLRAALQHLLPANLICRAVFV
jgi:hypothetical protein